MLAEQAEGLYWRSYPCCFAGCSPELRTQLATPSARALRLAADAERDNFAKLQLPASDAGS
jgi:hypothetical protein